MSHPDIARWKVAYGAHVMQRIALADGTVDSREAQLLGRAYPEDTLKGYGFLDEFGLTHTWESALEQAKTELPGRLSTTEKLLLLGFFHTACMTDAALDPREVQVVHDAAQELGVSIEQLAAHLDALTGQDGDAPPVRGR